MPLFEWNYTFVLGIKEIDQQHQLLIELVHRGYEEWKRGATAGELQSTLRVLLLHARSHFELEENWMQQTAYPEGDEHKKAHDTFKDAVLRLHACAGESPDSVLEDMTFLQNWVTHHIGDADASFINYLVSSNKWASRVTVDLPIHLMIEKYLSS